MGKPAACPIHHSCRTHSYSSVCAKQAHLERDHLHAWHRTYFRAAMLPVLLNEFATVSFRAVTVTVTLCVVQVQLLPLHGVW